MKNGKVLLLVEDDAIDQQTIKRAFKDLHITNPLVTSSDGEEALEFLHNKDNPKPCVILLDIKMPKMDGLEFLHLIKADEQLKMIPVVMFTSSNEERDKVESFNLSVAGYIVKPADYSKFLEAMRTINMYWTLSETPPERLREGE